MLDNPEQAITLDDVARVGTIGRQAFQSDFMHAERPVVIEDMATAWPAMTKWTPEFFQTVHGDKQVKVYDASFADPGATYMSSLQTISLKDYIDKVIHQDGDLRMFLYNMVSEAPELKDDIVFPDIADGFSKRFIFMFFGCRGSITPIHYDIDMAHVFHTPLHGRKRVVLFAPDQSTSLYRHPYTVRSYVDVDRPDFRRFPRMARLHGYETVLNPGDTLFIPGGFWHHIVYLDGGYAVSLRCSHERLAKRVEGLANLVSSTLVDRSMNKLFAERWYKWKERAADRRAAA